MHPHRTRIAVDKYRLRSIRTSGEGPGNGIRVVGFGGRPQDPLRNAL
ncbi:MAG: hypothetical protein M3N13_03080 [Candidatus Eremiobacteraeota bacterium]|nr:hypothetical protein [Candidatus Eremiobacteraeota bacterium]